jgi:hypothetical protein
MKEEWLFSGAYVPVDVETTQALVAEIKRLIDVVGGLVLKQGPGLTLHGDIEHFAELVAAQEREAIAQMFEGAPALVQSVRNDQGGCLVCGFTPKLVIEAIRARGTT